MLQTITTQFGGKGCIESLIGGRSENQDSAGWTETSLGLLIVVCDGMGGAKGGKYASELAVATMIEDVSASAHDGNPLSVMREAVSHANAVIYQEGQNEEYKGMGTTLTALLLTDKNAVAVHVGDSRIYQLRKGRKIFRTDDHSMVFDMVKAKIISEEQARLSDCSNIILKALGIAESVEPDISVIPYCKGDRFVLCSDGFWSAFDEDTLIKKLSWKGDPEGPLESLANEIDQMGKNEGCSHDNLTAAVMDVDRNSIMNAQIISVVNLRNVVLGLLLIISICVNIYFIKASAEMRRVKTELKELYNDLTSAQDELTARKVEKILQLANDGKMENNIDDTSEDE